MPQKQYSVTRDILRFEGKDSNAYWIRFSALLAISVVIATVGLYRNSAAVVIAAMLIAPLMTPILGIASAMVMGWSLRAFLLLLRVGLAAVCTVGLAWFIMVIANAPRGLAIPAEVLSRTDPGIEELMVALSAGFAGAYVQIQKKEISLLPGAAIGVSLVPPLAAAGILIYFDNYGEARDAVLLFVTNLAGIVVSACGVYLFAGRSGDWSKRRKRVLSFSSGFALTLGLLAIITAQLATTTYHRFQASRLQRDVSEAVITWAGDESVELMRVDVRPNKTPPHADIWMIIDLPPSPKPDNMFSQDQIPETLNGNVLRRDLLAVLGKEYQVILRYQLRRSGQFQLVTGQVSEAPSVQELDEKE